MKSTEASGQQYQIPKSALATDSVAAIMFTALLIFAVPPFYCGSPGLTEITLISIPSIYIYSMIVSPLLFSKSFDDPKLREYVPDNRIRFRLSERHPTRALDVGLFKFIVINQRDWSGRRQNWRALISHEHAHIKNRDTLFFHFTGISLLLIIVFLIFFALIFGSFFTLPLEQRIAVTANGGHWLLVPAMIFTISLLIFLFLTWIRRGLHNREYLADLASYQIDHEAIGRWLKDRVALQKTKRATRQWFSLDPLFSWMTHPTFNQRLDFLHGKLKRSRFGRIIEIIRISLLGYGAFLMIWIYSRPDLTRLAILESYHVYTAIPVLLFIVAFAVISLFLAECIVGNRYGDLGWFLFGNFVFLWIGIIALKVYSGNLTIGADEIVFPFTFLSAAISIILALSALYRFTNIDLFGIVMHVGIAFFGFLCAGIPAQISRSLIYNVPFAETLCRAFGLCF